MLDNIKLLSEGIIMLPKRVVENIDYDVGAMPKQTMVFGVAPDLTR